MQEKQTNNNLIIFEQQSGLVGSGLSWISWGTSSCYSCGDREEKPGCVSPKQLIILLVDT